MHPSDRPRSLALAAIAMLLSQPALAAEEPVTIAPSTKWQLDYAEDSCALQRLFGQEGKRVFFELRQFAPDGSSQLVVTTPDIKYLNEEPELFFAPDGTPMDLASAMGVEMGEFGKGFLSTTSMREKPDDAEIAGTWIDPSAVAGREAATTGYRVEKAFKEPFILQTGSMAKPMEAMRACIDELVGHWGLDAGAQRNLLRKASPNNLAETVKEVQSNYPEKALRGGLQGVLRLRVTVDESGRGTDCKAQLAIADEVFQKTACDIFMKKTEFNPALTRDGKPVASYWVASVIFRIV